MNDVLLTPGVELTITWHGSSWLVTYGVERVAECRTIFMAKAVVDSIFEEWAKRGEASKVLR